MDVSCACAQYGAVGIELKEQSLRWETVKLEINNSPTRRPRQGEQQGLKIQIANELC